MKQILLWWILLVLTFISKNIFAQESWSWQNPLPQGNILTGSFAIDSSTFIAVGGTGTIIKTTNSGSNWIT
jgi:photosystem II stability/assembly factor-like uncharacterized protein